MNNHPLSANQIGTIFFFLSRCSFTLFGYQFLFENSGSDAILAFFIASVLTIFLFVILLKIRKKKGTILKVSSSYLKTFFLILLLICFFLYLKDVITLIEKQWIEVSWLFLLPIFLFISHLLTSRGLHSLANTSFFLFFFFLPFFFMTLLGGITLVNVDYLKPFLLSSSFVFWKSVFFSIIALAPSWIFLVFLPRDQVDHKEKQEKIFFSYFIFGCLSIFLEIFLMHLTLGSHLTALYEYPLFALTSRISSFLILDRVFFLFSFYLLIDSTILLSIIFYGIKLACPSFIKKLVLQDRVSPLFEVSKNTYHLKGK